MALSYFRSVWRNDWVSPPRSSVVAPRSSVAPPRSSVAPPRSSVVPPRSLSSHLHPRSSHLDPRSLHLDPRSLHLDPHLGNSILKSVGTRAQIYRLFWLNCAHAQLTRVQRALIMAEPEKVVKLSDVQKLQQTVETFQTVLQSISKGDGDSVQVDDSSRPRSSGSGTR